MTTPGIYAKLGLIQSSLFVPKGQKNNFGNYNYRSCEDILRALKPLLTENKCSLFMTSRTETVGTWVYVIAKVTLCDIEDGTTIEVEAQAREPDMRKGMDAAQVSGSSLSYARKYALAGMFGIDNERDPDATNDHGASTSAPAPAKPKMSAKAKEAWDKYKSSSMCEGMTPDEQKTAYAKLVTDVIGKAPSSSVTDAEWDKVIDLIETV